MPGLFAILSPAKTLDMEAGPSATKATPTRPRLADRTKTLAGELRGYSPKRLETLMSISSKLANLNAERWRDFGTRGNARKPAALCFRGDVYQGLEAWTMDASAMKWAQQRLRILSGLYGLLRPLDVIQPYRLEMGTRLKTDQGANLYTFWEDRINKLVRSDMKEVGAAALVNLASDEYSRAARLEELDVPVVNVKFLQLDKGKAKFMSFYAKQSRGLMARWMADTRPKTLDALRGFDARGYELQATDSSDEQLVFTRPKPAPMSARPG